MEVSMAQYVQILILGLSLGGVFALMSSGLTLIFGVMRIVNLAHAAFIVIAAYISYWAFNNIGLDPILSILITFPTMFLLGVLVYRVLFSKVIENTRFVEITVLLTFALGLVIEGLLTYFYTGIYRSTTPRYATDTLHLGSILFSRRPVLCNRDQHSAPDWALGILAHDPVGLCNSGYNSKPHSCKDRRCKCTPDIDDHFWIGYRSGWRIRLFGKFLVYLFPCQTRGMGNHHIGSDCLGWYG
jgi:branched-subunit amino acid ABC-type transport system permease component